MWIKYRDVSVKHCNNLPVSPRSLTASCRPRCAPKPTAPEQKRSAAMDLSPNKPLLARLDRFRSFRRMSGAISLFKDGEAIIPRLRNYDTTISSSYRYESRSDIRLESVANAHTAADLHVRPVSKTALVSRSWAPRASKKYTMRDFPQSSDTARVASLPGR
jgi:hypothetical protein